jgi:TPR repeat protein
MYAAGSGIRFNLSYTSFSLETYFGAYMKLSLAETTAVVESDPENELARNRKDILLAKEASEQSVKIQLLQAAVDRGCPSAQFHLGLVYLKENEPELALRLIKMSAEAGLNKSQFRLSVLLDNRVDGQELEIEDVKESFKWMIRSALAGDSDAQGLVSLFFSGEKGTTKFKNVAKSFHYASLAAAQGNVLGQLRLGILLQFCCEKNEEKAIEVLTLAAEKGFSYAIYIGPGHQDRGDWRYRSRREAASGSGSSL